MADIVDSLGLLALGTRFKRVGERLQNEVAVILAERNLDIAAAHLVLLTAIDRNGPMSIGDLANVLGIAQPGVTRAVGQLIESGHVRFDRQAGDRRVKIVTLSESTKALIAEAQATLYDPLELAVTELCDSLPSGILQAIAAIEQRLDNSPLIRRMSRHALVASR